MSGRAIWLGIGAVGAVFIAVLLFSSLASEDTTATGELQSVVLHRGNTAEPSTLDPHKASGTWESRIVNDLFEGLYTYAPDATPTLGVATGHTVSDDGLIYTFTLREDARWSDGTPITAYDFEYSFRRMVNPETVADLASYYYVVENGREINVGEIDDLSQLGARALDDHTFEVRLNQPEPSFIQLTTRYPFHPVPRHVIDVHGDDWSTPGTMVTNGPYVLEQWVPNDFIHSVRNPNYYDTANVPIDEVYYYPTDDASAALRRFRAGELDLNTDYPEQQHDWLMDNLPNATRTTPSICVGYISANIEAAPTSDVRVRQALNMSINREMLSERVLGLGEAPATSVVTPFAPNYQSPEPDWVSLSFPERQDRARALLAEAGYDETNPLRFVYRYRESIKNRRAAIAIANMWEEIGAEVELVNTEVAVHYADIQVGDFQIADAGWCAFVVQAERLLALSHTYIGIFNYSNYYGEEFEAIFDEAVQIADVEARSALLAEAEMILQRDVPIIPTYYYVDKNLVGVHVQGWVNNPGNVHLTRYLSIDEDLRPVQVGFWERVFGASN